ncbi:helix-turn-helix domain-containing protein [uncultured Nostoc sp.]|uniref:helix-turn-helix domain-containing protein n=1 Tax=uncultured Nostoc sp. TaxID=340711 RepID=UPI003457E35A
MGLNDFKLKRAFKEVFGTTVLGYVQSLRLEQAQRLLRDTNFTSCRNCFSSRVREYRSF